MDEVLHEGPGYTIARTDVESTMTHYPGRPTRPHDSEDPVRGPFVDLTVEPMAVDSIPEVGKSAGLRALIMAAVGPHAQLMTIGCDVAEFHGTGEGSRPCVGAYVNYAFRDQMKASSEQANIDLAWWMLHPIGPPPEPIHVYFAFVIEPLKSFYGQDGCYSVMAKVFGYGSTFDAAWVSYEWAADQLATSVARQRDPTPLPQQRPVV